jgi:hypothetical protein
MVSNGHAAINNVNSFFITQLNVACRTIIVKTQIHLTSNNIQNERKRKRAAVDHVRGKQIDSEN